ncbi:hybrid sensor histidine kinase/response regulator [Tautonia plasticadhaerens]|uniref:histidine kinase n=1 Tax=Tautonia plasticadhaerens TaxID=2527974 RepID=A0A518H7M4_9BACT|nr:ATP-binding protein [Tautonia plasticadhaerens]QDV36843.1 Sensor histidine kinase TmoS [Tautonia plasticadhaerens]
MDTARRGTPPPQVLVVEDDRDALANLRDILELDAFVVDAASSAAEALDRPSDRWSAYGAMILDRRLPDADFDEVMPRLRALAPDAELIVVTGLADLRGAIDALRGGASDYLLKPIDPDALRASLSRALERRELRLARRRSDAAFRTLVESAESVIVITRLDRSIVYFSPFAERLTGYPAGEVFGTCFHERLVDPEDRGRAEDALRRLRAGEPVRGLEGRLRRRDGSTRCLVWNARLLDDYEGMPAILSVGHDISDLKEAQQRAVQSERLAAIGQMVTGLAHESRNALQRGQSCLEMLALKVADRPEAVDLIRRAQKAQDHLHHLFEDVRSYAAPIRLEAGRFDLPSVWREAWSYLDSAARQHSATLSESVDAPITRCWLDPFRLVQVFRNILENALTSGAGPVAIEVSCSPASLEGRDALRVAIRDNGPGLNAEQVERIFEPFYTTKARGTGLGMAICRRIVEAHGGRIAVGTPGGPGAEIILTLPREPT